MKKLFVFFKIGFSPPPLDWKLKKIKKIQQAEGIEVEDPVSEKRNSPPRTLKKLGCFPCDSFLQIFIPGS